MKKTMPIENIEFAAVDAALKRAAKVAHTLARKTKTPCYIWEGGKIVNVTEQKKVKTDAVISLKDGCMAKKDKNPLHL